MSNTSLLSSFLFPLIIFFLSIHPITITSSTTHHHHDLIQETCKNCSKSDPNISFNFCTNSLRADSRTHCAKNLTALGLISVKLARRNVSDTKDHIMEMLMKRKKKEEEEEEEGGSSYMKECLEDCLEVYSDAIQTLREGIRDYRAKRYAECNIKVSSVIDASSTCEDGFKEKRGVVSPLTKRNNNAFQLSAIALSIINMLSAYRQL